MSERYQSRIVVDLLLERKNEITCKKEILMMLRQGTGHRDGQFDLPGGHLEEGEDLFDAMIREAKEEIGIDVKRKYLKISHINHHYTKGVLKFLFTVEKYQGNPTNAEPDKCAEIKWVEPDKLPENTIPRISAEIENLMKNIYYSNT